jgi:hypothetical protein
MMMDDEKMILCGVGGLDSRYYTGIRLEILRKL